MEFVVRNFFPQKFDFLRNKFGMNYFALLPKLSYYIAESIFLRGRFLAL